MNVIIINGKVYEVKDRGSRHCRDCDLYDECKTSAATRAKLLCDSFPDNGRIILKLNKSLTQNFNNK